MSMKLMVRVMEEIEVTRPQQLVLLSMAENANDDGSKCFPSVDLIAWKAGYKPRAVVDIIRELRQMGVLKVVKEHRAQRATEYHIHLKKAPQKPSFNDWQEDHGRHAKNVRRDAVSRDESEEVQSDERCNLTSGGVQSHVRGVQSHVKNTRENAPEPVSTQSRTSQRTSHSGGAKKSTKAKPAPKTLLPDDFYINKRLKEWADNKGFTVEEMESQLERFQNNARMKQHRYADWDAAFQNWMHNARDWGHLDDKKSNVTQFKKGKDDDAWNARDYARLAIELERQGR